MPQMPLAKSGLPRPQWIIFLVPDALGDHPCSPDRTRMLLTAPSQAKGHGECLTCKALPAHYYNDWHLFQGCANVVVFNRVVGPRVLGLEPDEAAIRQCCRVRPDCLEKLTC